MKLMSQQDQMLRLDQVVLHSCTIQSSELCNNKNKIVVGQWFSNVTPSSVRLFISDTF